MWTQRRVTCYAARKSKQQIQNKNGYVICSPFVIGISLAFPAGFYVFLNNIQIMSTGWDETIEINLFLDTTINEQRANDFANRILKRDDIL